MTTLNYAKQWTALLIAGSYVNNTGSGNIPNAFIIGTGSGTVLTTQTVLFTPSDRQVVTSTDPTTNFKIKYTGDWTSTEVSGLSFKEWGLAGSAAGTTGSMWTKTVFGGITFDGTNELRIEETLEVF